MSSSTIAGLSSHPALVRVSFPNLGVRDCAELDVFVEREAVGPADFHERPLAAFDFSTCLGPPRGDQVKDQADAVLVGVNQVTGSGDTRRNSRLVEVWHVGKAARWECRGVT